MAGAAKSWPLGRKFQLVVGLAGAVLAIYCWWILRRIGRSPGDDNMIALLYVAALVVGLVLAWGIVRAARDVPLRRGKLWLSSVMLVIGGVIVWLLVL